MRKMVSDIHSFMVWSLWSWELSLVNVSPNLIVAFFFWKNTVKVFFLLIGCLSSAFSFYGSGCMIVTTLCDAGL